MVVKIGFLEHDVSILDEKTLRTKIFLQFDGKKVFCFDLIVLDLERGSRSHFWELLFC